MIPAGLNKILLIANTGMLTLLHLNVAVKCLLGLLRGFSDGQKFVSKC